MGVQRALRSETYIFFRQEMEGTEQLIVVELEALRRLEPLKILHMCRCLWYFFWAPLSLILPMRILGRDSRTSPAAAVMTVILHRRAG